MSDPPLPVHSVAEAHLYVMARPCDACGRGPVAASDDVRHGREGESPMLHLETVCQACGHRTPLIFDVSRCRRDDHGEPIRSSRINETDEPSRILDVGQWLVLFQVILAAASDETDRTEARRLGYEAAQCLEEALKFYRDGDAPPDDALFTPRSRQRFEQAPESFSRARLIDMRSKLPTLNHMERQINAPVATLGKHKKWWQVWK